jgi:hypothetical protein
MPKSRSLERLRELREQGRKALQLQGGRKRSLTLVPIGDHAMKHTFDEACELLHYAGACRRVGRLLRLAVVKERDWVGGLVLGSPFPNLRPRDDAFGLTKHVQNWRDRGLANPWSAENEAYWHRLQQVANHARSYVFPEYQGHGLGVAAQGLLESVGRRHWETIYGPVAGFDTLCTDPTSRLFSDNGWMLVGRTKGYSRDPGTLLSRRVADGRFVGVRDNAGLSRSRKNPRWWIWVKVLSRIE